MIAEGEEEVGSPNLVPFVVEHAERLACDVVLISDYAKGVCTPNCIAAALTAAREHNAVGHPS